MKRAFNYFLQAFKRYKVDPIILIVYVNTLHSYVVQRTMASRFPGGYAFPSDLWAADCIILSKESLGEGNIDTSLNSLIVLGLFFTSRALSIVNAPFADDPTMQYLCTLALSHKKDQLEFQNREYERLLSLANTVGSPAATNSSASSSINNNNDRYKQGMDFVEQFKQARIQKGHKKWIG